jgi:FKBP-type peptidyl-prolyl cis-trans isomerase
MKTLALIVSACVAILTGGCGDGDSSASASHSIPTASSAEAKERSEPEVKARVGAPPKGLVTRDVIIGTGPTADMRKEVVINFVGFDYETGRETGNSWEKGKPSDFELRSVLTLEGLRTGIVGMRAGGRREMIIPPRRAFGSAGAPPEIPPNATMVYVIDLLRVAPIEKK